LAHKENIPNITGEDNNLKIPYPAFYPYMWGLFPPLMLLISVLLTLTKIKKDIFSFFVKSEINKS
jgi:hypothetical protein